MAVFDLNVMTNIVENIGKAEIDLQSVLELSRNSSFLYSLRESRDFVFENTTNTYLSNDTTLEASMQSAENSASSSLSLLTSPSVVALNKYINNIFGVSFKSYYKYTTDGTGASTNTNGINFSDSTFTEEETEIYNEFRSVWRKGNKEELVVKTADFDFTSNTTVTLASGINDTDFDAKLDTSFELRPVADDTGTFHGGSSSVSLVVTGQKLSGLTENVTVSVPASFTRGTGAIAIGTNKKFIKITKVIIPAITAGTATNPTFEIWVV